VNKTPICVIGFNRPDLLSNLLSCLPDDGRNVYISIDGSRNLQDSILVEQSIEVVLKYSAGCVANYVTTRFSSHNQGCKKAVAGAISWAFMNEERLIILEDDINPCRNFFLYCDTALEKYRLNLNIWQLNGWTPLNNLSIQQNFYLTDYSHIWGWATWKNRWQFWNEDYFDLRASFLHLSKSGYFSHHHRNFARYWIQQLNNVERSVTDTWDVQWLFTMWSHQARAISPIHRLSGNIGFDYRATHTQKEERPAITAQPNLKINMSGNEIKLDKNFPEFDMQHDYLAYNMDKWSYWKGQVLSFLKIKF